MSVHGKIRKLPLADLLRTWRAFNNLSLRKAAKQIGIYYVTLQRIEAGRDVKWDTFLAILTWLTGRR